MSGELLLKITEGIGVALYVALVLTSLYLIDRADQRVRTFQIAVVSLLSIVIVLLGRILNHLTGQGGLP